jgi:hypothetical protein
MVLAHGQQASNLASLVIANVSGRVALELAVSVSHLWNLHISSCNAGGIYSVADAVSLNDVIVDSTGEFGIHMPAASLTSSRASVSNVGFGLIAHKAYLNDTHIHCSMSCVNAVQEASIFNSSFVGDGSLGSQGVNISIPESLSVHHSSFRSLGTAILMSMSLHATPFTARWNSFELIGKAAVTRQGAGEGPVTFDYNTISESSGDILAHFDMDNQQCRPGSPNYYLEHDLSMQHNVVTGCNSTSSLFVIGYGRFDHQNSSYDFHFSNNTFIGNRFASSAVEVDLPPAYRYHFHDNIFIANQGTNLIQLAAGGGLTELGLHNNVFNSSLVTFDIASNVIIGQATINASLNHWSVPAANVAQRISSNAYPHSFQPVIVSPMGSSAKARDTSNNPLMLPDGSLAGVLLRDMTLAIATEYNVSATIRVAANATLTLEAGVVLRFASDAELVIEGGLATHGTPSSPVLMLPQSTMQAGDVRAGKVALVMQEPEAINFATFGRASAISSPCVGGCNRNALCSAVCLGLNATLFHVFSESTVDDVLSLICSCGGASQSVLKTCPSFLDRLYPISDPPRWQGVKLLPGSLVNLTGVAMAAFHSDAIVAQSTAFSMVNTSIYLAKGTALKLNAIPGELRNLRFVNVATGLELQNHQSSEAALALDGIMMDRVTQGIVVINSTLASVTIAEATFTSTSTLATMHNVQADISLRNVFGQVVIQALDWKNISSAIVNNASLSSVSTLLPLVRVQGFTGSLALNFCHLQAPSITRRPFDRTALIDVLSRSPLASFSASNTMFDLQGQMLALDLQNGATMHLIDVSLLQSSATSSSAKFGPALNISLDCIGQHSLSQSSLVGPELLAVRLLSSQTDGIPGLIDSYLCLNITGNTFSSTPRSKGVSLLFEQSANQGFPANIAVNNNRFDLQDRSGAVFVKLSPRSFVDMRLNYWGLQPLLQDTKSLGRNIVHDGLFLTSRAAIAVVAPYYVDTGLTRVAGQAYVDSVDRKLSGLLDANVTLSSTWTVTGDVIVPSSLTLTALSGTTIVLQDGVSMIFTSQAQLRGERDEPIVFRGLGTTRGGRVIFLSDASSSDDRRREAAVSQLSYVTFENLGLESDTDMALSFPSDNQLASVQLYGAWQVDNVLMNNTRGGLTIDLTGSEGSSSVSNSQFHQVSGVALHVLTNNSTAPMATSMQLSISNLTMVKVESGIFTSCNADFDVLVQGININDFRTGIVSTGCRGSITDSTLSGGSMYDQWADGSAIQVDLPDGRPFSIANNSLSNMKVSKAIHVTTSSSILITDNVVRVCADAGHAFYVLAVMYTLMDHLVRSETVRQRVLFWWEQPFRHLTLYAAGYTKPRAEILFVLCQVSIQGNKILNSLAEASGILFSTAKGTNVVRSLLCVHAGDSADCVCSRSLATWFEAASSITVP